MCILIKHLGKLKLQKVFCLLNILLQQPWNWSACLKRRLQKDSSDKRAALTCDKTPPPPRTLQCRALCARGSACICGCISQRSSYEQAGKCRHRCILGAPRYYGSGGRHLLRRLSFLFWLKTSPSSDLNHERTHAERWRPEEKREREAGVTSCFQAGLHLDALRPLGRQAGQPAFTPARWRCAGATDDQRGRR